MGLAVCAKLTAATLYILPAFLILIPAMVLRLNSAGKKKRIPCALKLGLLAAAILGAIYLPWAARAWLSTGNPFFPALSGVYHNPFWAPEQTQRWLVCHQQTDFWRADYWSALAKRVNQPGYWALLPCLLVFLPNRHNERRDGRRALALYAAAAYAMWCLAHGSADRFILPALMAAAPVSAAVFSEALERRRWIILALLSALALTAYPGIKADMFRFGYLKPWTALPDSASSRIWQAQHVQGAPQGARAALWASANLPRGAKLLLVYEARFALFDRDCEGNTIFDRSVLLDALESEPSATPAEIRATLRRKGFTHILINNNDLHLFTRMYLGKYMEKILAPSREPSIPTSEPQASNSQPRITNHEPRTTSPEPRTTNPEPRTTNPEPRTPNPDDRGLRPSDFIYHLPHPYPEDFYIPFMADPRYPPLRKALLQFLGECRQNASRVELNKRDQAIVWIYDLRSTIDDLPSTTRDSRSTNH